MGWTGYYATHYKNGKIDRKAECDAYFMEGLNRGNFKVLKSTMKGSVYYAAIQDMVKYDGKDENGKSIYTPIGDGKIWAAVFLTSVEKGMFYYKDMDETYGPCYYDCPKSILNLLSDTDNEFALAWRNCCISKATRNSELSKLPIGTTIEFKASNGHKIKAYKHEPAYQFKRAFWMTMNGGYIPASKIKDWKVVDRNVVGC